MQKMKLLSTASLCEGPQMCEKFLWKEKPQTSEEHNQSLALNKNTFILPELLRYKIPFNSFPLSGGLIL